ncbi:unnamed protein product [Owenia fusiformis]|uniref:G-protein coupled receptors family 1 profile domain-containing protein n=1 Tax=Owenia fusiformis TaxID=6347 RepID=A0A8S4NM03_OWEFU|nr:unnamed protein product [Owenia fusiformis]
MDTELPKEEENNVNVIETVFDSQHEQSSDTVCNGYTRHVPSANVQPPEIEISEDVENSNDPNSGDADAQTEHVAPPKVKRLSASCNDLPSFHVTSCSPKHSQNKTMQQQEFLKIGDQRQFGGSMISPGLSNFYFSTASLNSMLSLYQSQSLLVEDPEMLERYSQIDLEMDECLNLDQDSAGPNSSKQEDESSHEKEGNCETTKNSSTNRQEFRAKSSSDIRFSLSSSHQDISLTINNHLDIHYPQNQCRSCENMTFSDNPTKPETNKSTENATLNCATSSLSCQSGIDGSNVCFNITSKMSDAPFETDESKADNTYENVVASSSSLDLHKDPSLSGSSVISSDDQASWGKGEDASDIQSELIIATTPIKQRASVGKIFDRLTGSHSHQHISASQSLLSNHKTTNHHNNKKTDCCQSKKLDIPKSPLIKRTHHSIKQLKSSILKAASPRSNGCQNGKVSQTSSKSTLANGDGCNRKVLTFDNESIKHNSVTKLRQKSSNELKALLVKNKNTGGNPMKRLTISKRTASNEAKASKVLGIIFGVFVILWTPFFVMNVVSVTCMECMAQLTPELASFITWFGYLASLANPIIYTMFNTAFRRAFVNILTCKYRKGYNMADSVYMSTTTNWMTDKRNTTNTMTNTLTITHHRDSRSQ